MELLRTKLNRPVTAASAVCRPRLQNEVLQGLHLPEGVVLVSAPAGYGKTTLALEALTEAGLPCAWLTLDDGDNDPGTFLAYLLEAFRSAGLVPGKDLELLVSETGIPAGKVILTSLMNLLLDSGVRRVLVLDDYQCLRDRRVTELIQFMLGHQPPELSVMLLTREDPELPLSRWRVRGRLTEIRAGQLGFQEEEAAALLRALGIETSAVHTARLCARTEGWAAGLQLGALVLRSLPASGHEAMVARFSGSHAYVMDYLFEEVMLALPEAQRQFLRAISVAPRFCAGLCEALSGTEGAGALLSAMEHANLFLVPLDDRREWYRFHPLFAEALRMGLSSGEAQALNLRAAHWHAAAGHPEEAFRSALAAEAYPLALELLEGMVFRLFQEARLDTLVRGCQALPQDMVRHSEVLSVRLAIALFILERPAEAQAHLAGLGPDFFPGTGAHNQGLMIYLRAMGENSQGRDARPLTEQALALLQPWDPIAMTSALGMLGHCHLREGHTREALEAYQKAWAYGSRMGCTFVTTLVLMNYGLCLISVGRQAEAAQLFEAYRQQMKAHMERPLPYIGLILHAEAGMALLNNAPDAADALMEEATALCRSIGYTWPLSRLDTLLTEAARGNTKAAAEALEPCLQRWKQEGRKALWLRGAERRLTWLLAEGQKQRAAPMMDAIRAVAPEFPASPLPWLAEARWEMENKNMEKAEQALREVLRVLEVSGELPGKIAAWALLAGLAHRRNSPAAGAWLDKAAAAALDTGYVRCLLDELFWVGPVIAGSRWETHPRLVEAVSAPAPPPVTLNWGETLSSRELEILRCIAGGMSNSAISEKLFISTNTTQWHISRLYAKLEVRSRTQAILRARELGLNLP